MKKLFTLLIVFFPILSIYVTFIPNLSIADLLLSIIVFPLITISIPKKINIRKSLWPIYLFFFYILFTLLIQIFNSTGVGVFSTIRYLIYLLAIPLCFRFFDFRIGIKIINKVTNLVSIYVILQFVTFFFFSYILPWKIPGLPLVDPKFAEAGDQFFFIFYRPTGIFLEPTHFAQFALVSLCYYFTQNIYDSGSIYKVILPTLGILASASSLGFFAIIILFGFWTWNKFVIKFNFTRLIILTSIILLALIYISQIDYFRFIFERVFGGEGESFGAAFGYRFNSVEYFLNTKLSILDWLIGKGRSSEDVYFTGLFYFLNANGIIGVIIYILLMIYIIKNSLHMGSTLLVLALLLSTGSEFVANFGILFYMAFAISEIKTINSYKEIIYAK